MRGDGQDGLEDGAVEIDLGDRPTRKRKSAAIEPGIESFAGKPEDQTLGVLSLTGGTFSELGAILRWELLRDVASLLGPPLTP